MQSDVLTLTHEEKTKAWFANLDLIAVAPKPQKLEANKNLIAQLKMSANPIVLVTFMPRANGWATLWLDQQGFVLKNGELYGFALRLVARLPA